MKQDKILQMFFEPERWQYAIEKGIVKDINKTQLYQLTMPEVRAQMYLAIKNGRYEIAPPHTALIPKDTPGEFRTVYVNEPIDRIFLSIANDLLFDIMRDKIHPSCKSYLKGTGCTHAVEEASWRISTQKSTNGWKSDLSKYFDSVPLSYIDKAFDDVESIHGHSAVIDVLRKYYHSDYYFDTDKQLQKSYQSLKQGCAVASYLADVILYHIDDMLSSLDGFYIRYSDDMLFIGKDYEKAMQILSEELGKMQMKLNPKKIEYLSASTSFKFLGFTITGEKITLSRNRVKTFQREIESRTIRRKDNTLRKAINAVNRYLYKGNGEFSFATQVLTTVNVKEDLDTMNAFVMDCLRAVHTRKHRVGGLGYVPNNSGACIVRGRGRNVSANKRKTEPTIEGYMSLGCARNAMLTSRDIYRALVSNL